MKPTERQYLMWLLKLASRGNSKAKLTLLKKAIGDHIKKGRGPRALATFCVANILA